ncbi:MAG: hypothetical protein GKR87_00520 [Kiritimatiellae bacterium]|nr:hypothetical protein [Kiritimatiellia bacterium]
MPTLEWRKRLDLLVQPPQLIIEPTGPGNPAYKRNIVLQKSDAERFALIDADAYPRMDWLGKGLPLLQKNVTVVTGPNLTPPHDHFSRRISGRVMESPIGFGPAYIRHVPKQRQYVNEMPTCNMIIRRQRGIVFREDLNTSEDMMYCLEIRAKGQKVLYDPDVVVFHHRRKILRPFMKQFYNYGLDKGRLRKSKSDVSYIWQAAPAFFSLYAAGLLVLLPWIHDHFLYRALCAPVFLYLLAVVVESIRLSQSYKEIFVAPFAFLAGHIGYGIGFIRGFFLRDPLNTTEDLTCLK